VKTLKILFYFILFFGSVAGVWGRSGNLKAFNDDGPDTVKSREYRRQTSTKRIPSRSIASRIKRLARENNLLIPWDARDSCRDPASAEIFLSLGPGRLVSLSDASRCDAGIDFDSTFGGD